LKLAEKINLFARKARLYIKVTQAAFKELAQL
jgi:hypothetical protein